MSCVYKINEIKVKKCYKFGMNFRVEEFWRMIIDEGFLGGGVRGRYFLYIICD